MEQQLNEVKRMQQLAGIITEAPAGVNVIKNPIIRKQAPAAPAPKQTTTTSAPKKDTSAAPAPKQNTAATAPKQNTPAAPAPKKDISAAPASTDKKNDLSKIEFRDAESQKYEKNKKKYTFRININGKPKVSVFVDSPDISEKEAKNLFANWRNSTSGQGVIGPEGAKVEFQAVDTASDKVLNSYKMDVARDPHYAGWGHSSTHGTV